MSPQMRFQCTWSGVCFATKSAEIWFRIRLVIVIAVFLVVANTAFGTPNLWQL